MAIFQFQHPQELTKRLKRARSLLSNKFPDYFDSLSFGSKIKDYKTLAEVVQQRLISTAKAEICMGCSGHKPLLLCCFECKGQLCGPCFLSQTGADFYQQLRQRKWICQECNESTPHSDAVIMETLEKTSRTYKYGNQGNDCRSRAGWLEAKMMSVEVVLV